MTRGLLQVVTDTLALLVAALSAFKDRQTPIMAILLMLLIEVHAPVCLLDIRVCQIEHTSKIV